MVFCWVFCCWFCMILCTYFQFKKALLFNFFFLSVEVKHLWIYIYINIYINKIIKNIKYKYSMCLRSRGHPVDCKIGSRAALQHGTAAQRDADLARTATPAEKQRAPTQGTSCSLFLKDGPLLHGCFGDTPPQRKVLPTAGAWHGAGAQPTDVVLCCGLNRPPHRDAVQALAQGTEQPGPQPPPPPHGNGLYPQQ